MDKIFDRDIARNAARKAVDEVIAKLKQNDAIRDALSKMHDSERVELMRRCVDEVQAEILAEQDRQLGVVPVNPQAPREIRLPESLRARLMKDAQRDGDE